MALRPTRAGLGIETRSNPLVARLARHSEPGGRQIHSAQKRLTSDRRLLRGGGLDEDR